ncbi:MAG: TIGR04255 family protein [Alcaligenaceae bacterium]|jgi:uncharacterized protein (TIGR04255 family)|nr:TIGR04255 family protein [Alcaligenaceae bacterium]
MQTPLPKKLNADPIIDAIIEIRVVVNQPLNSIMPGVLLQAQDVGYLRSQELPAASIPEAVRRSDPNLRYQPLVRAEFKDGFNLLIGDAVLAVVASMPYVGGVGFKSKATQILTLLLGLPVVERVQRLSMKYTDFIEAESLQQLDTYLNLDLKLGSVHAPETLGYDLNLQVEGNEVLHLLRLVALTRLGDKEGLILDVDTIKQIDDLPAEAFKPQLVSTLDNLHQQSKTQFFSLLTPQALAKLEAVYE